MLFSKCMLRHGVLRVLCRSVSLVLYGPFCHGALKHCLQNSFFKHLFNYIKRTSLKTHTNTHYKHFRISFVLSCRRSLPCEADGLFSAHLHC